MAQNNKKRLRRSLAITRIHAGVAVAPGKRWLNSGRTGRAVAGCLLPVVREPRFFTRR